MQSPSLQSSEPVLPASHASRLSCSRAESALISLQLIASHPLYVRERYGECCDHSMRALAVSAIRHALVAWFQRFDLHDAAPCFDAPLDDLHLCALINGYPRHPATQDLIACLHDTETQGEAIAWPAVYSVIATLLATAQSGMRAPTSNASPNLRLN